MVTELSDTRRVFSLGGKNGENGLAVRIKNNIVKVLDLKAGSLVELKIKNTGIVLPKMNRGKNGKEESQEQQHQEPGIQFE